MSYRILGFLKYRMTNGINCKCGFTRGSNPKRGNIIDIYNKLARQDITDNIIIFKSQQMQYAGRGC